MFRLAPLLFIAFGLISCSSKPSTHYKQLKSVPLTSVGLVMQFPASFREFSLDEEIGYWAASGLPNDEVDKKIAYLETLKLSPNATQYLADSMNITNDVRIIQSPVAIKVGKYTSKESFLALNEMIQEQSQLLDIRYEALENNYFSLANGNDVMKIRYKATETRVKNAGLAPLDFDEDALVYYTTFYVVTAKKTVIIVVNHESEDFEYFIRTIRFF